MSANDNPPIGTPDSAAQSSVRQVRLAVPLADAEGAADRLWCAGAGAIEEVTSATTIELRTVLGGTDDGVRTRLGALPSTWDLTFVDVDTRPAHTWRDYAEPIEVAADLWVVPAWWTGPMPPTGTVLVVEPGAAFGLGDHPTTRLCLASLHRFDLGGRSVLDVGCGSGVLSVLAARSGATSVTAVDISEAAVEATMANATLNGVEIEASATPIEALDGPYDVIVANILAPILISMADDLVRLLAPGGRLLISGVLDGGFDHVVSALDPLEVANTAIDDGWAAVELSGPEITG